jgi:predicted cobalt transporter CbtA
LVGRRGFEHIADFTDQDFDTNGRESALCIIRNLAMVGGLLTRGMLVGIVAGILCFGFLKLVGEPPVDRAIAFETALDEAKDKAAADDATAKGMTMPKQDPEPELVSRSVQAGIGLFTGVTVYNAAFGGLFALVFAFAYRRMGDFDARTTSALLAISGIVAVYIVPSLKYPANPPSVGAPETIGMRTGLYFAMIAISLAAMIAAWMLRNRLLSRYGGWNAALIAGAAYLIVVIAVALALPSVNEVPDGFPAVVLWQFRIASAGAQVIMWTTLGLAFGALMERAAASRSGLRLNMAGF